MLATALRETVEERGLVMNRDYQLISDFVAEAKYEVRGHKDGILRPKVVTYFLGKLTNQEAQVCLSEEHTEFKWLSSEDSLSIGGFENMRPIFEMCDQKINQL